MDFQAIQQGLANAAATIAGLNTLPTVPPSITPPFFGVDTFQLDYHKTFGASGLTETLFECGLYVSEADVQTGKEQLVSYVAPTGASSILAALESDKTLGGAAKAVKVERVRGAYQLYEIGNGKYIGAVFDVRVWA